MPGVPIAGEPEGSHAQGLQHVAQGARVHLSARRKHGNLGVKHMARSYLVLDLKKSPYGVLRSLGSNT